LKLIARNSLSRSVGSVAWLKIRKICFSYKYFFIFVCGLWKFFHGLTLAAILENIYLMKQTIFFLILFLTLSGFNNTESVSLKTFTEEAMSKSLIGNDPIIVANPFSAKIYSKLDLRHPVWNNLKREELVVIPKNSDLLEKLWGKQAKENGVIVYRAAQENKYDLKKLRYVLNGKEINKIDADTLNIKDVNSFIIVKDRNSEERVAFINSQK
jgi:hypothetical protein